MKPTKININFLGKDENITKISCGSHHVLILTDIGSVYGWGDNNFGQMGIGNSNSYVGKIETVQNINFIHCCFDMSFAIDRDSIAFSWGKNANYMLGNGINPNEITMEPKKIYEVEQNHKNEFIKKPIKLSSICCSNSMTYFLSKNSKLYSCGINEHKYYRPLPERISDMTFRDFTSTYYFKKNCQKSCVSDGEKIWNLSNFYIKKTNYKKPIKYFAKEYMLTFRTIDIRIEYSGHKLSKNFYIQGELIIFYLKPNHWLY